MRAPRADVAWSRSRARRRTRYEAYITSEEWFARRERWLEEWTIRHPGVDPGCAVCGETWTLSRGDLHHATYDRLGNETFEDLVPLCRRDHDLLHDVYDAQPGWRRMGRVAGTRGIITALRRQRTQNR